MTTYKAFDVLEVSPNWKDGLSATAQRSIVKFDPGTGKATVEDRTGLQSKTSTFSWFLQDRTSISALKTFITARKGAAVPFWLPTWKNDLPLNQDAIAADQTILIKNIGYTNRLFTSKARRDIAIMLSDGSKLYRRVTAATDNGTTESLTLDSAVGVPVSASTSIISFLMLCRMNEDESTIQWHNKNTAEAELRVCEIPSEVP